MVRRHERAWRRDDSGAAAVEFALVSVLLLTIVFAILQYGFFFYQMQSANHAVREGARLAAVGIDDCGDFQDTVVERAGVADPAPTDVTVTYTPTTPPVAGSTVVVSIAWAPEDFAFPFVPFLTNSTYDQRASSRVEAVGAADDGC